MENEPKLFGISGKSNRDFARRSHWGKNEFNSSFPTALLCYMASQKIEPVYLRLESNFNIGHYYIPVADLFGMDPANDHIYFSFEDSFQPYQNIVRGALTRSDLVIIDISKKTNQWLRGLEIKLTALPDNSTCHLTEDKYGCEMVFRQPAIIHLALSISSLFREKKTNLQRILSPVCSRIFNWRNKEEMVERRDDFVKVLNEALLLIEKNQIPFIAQPIWKTVGKRSVLCDNCLDVFVWSNLAFTRLFIDRLAVNSRQNRMTRQLRCLVWLVRMLFDFAQMGRIDPSLVPSEMAYELQTDKAFSISGRNSWHYMNSKELVIPRIRKDEIKKIILNGGQRLLSPERRFDAAIVNTLGLFDEE